MKPKLPPLAYVTWVDAYAEIDTYTEKELRAKPPYATYCSVGFLLEVNNDTVKLIAECELDADGEVVGYRSANVIPRSCVLSIQKIWRKK